MSTTIKTHETDINVFDFINSFVQDLGKRQDSIRLIALMRQWSGFEPAMWGPSIIGFGSYHYKYDSGHEGSSLLIGFSPRKSKFSLYVTPQGNLNNHLINELGKVTLGKACIYFKNLSDLNIETLEKLCMATIEYIEKHHECACRKKG